jgi:D-amino-acid dehydrogenase
MGCALYLQRDGHAVTVIDREGPGAGASRSSAGLISSASCVPIGTPGVLRRVPAMLRDPLAPLTIRWRYLPRLAPWLLRFVRASAPARVEAIADALASLVRVAIESYRPLLASAGAEALVRDDGVLYTYATDASFAAAQAGLDLRIRRGMTMEILTGDAVRELEPDLAPVRHGVLFPRTLFTTDPHRLVEALAEAFVRDGGKLVRAEVSDVEPASGDRHVVRTRDGTHVTDAVVLAAGAWSRALAARLGAPVPLDTERGYVVMLPSPGVQVHRALISGDYHFAVTPMAAGLRLAGTVELAGLQAPPNPRRAERLIEGARRMFPRLDPAGATQWMGFRPSMPDSLPVIGRSPRHPSVFLAFGHGHLGLTFGAITGKLIAELVGGRPTTVDVTPYRADRF